MTRGFGNPQDYPRLIQQLARFLPPSSRTKEVWDTYTRNREKIEEKYGGRMPTLAQLRRLG